ncbi:MAG TPA: YHS domain-containing (seleno)protein [Xanthobacteraceae bacterium]|nr:YHS domain-containing (seleno)protein [Xanthobacteraceae bacterium]
MALLAGLLAAAVVGMAGLCAATTERIVTDPHTGLAISGYDPVAYFADSAARRGRAGIEARFGGATWRFRNLGNRAAFLMDPQIYMPAFGGYDPTGIARGVAVAGHPEIWLIVGEQLYLFHNEKTRAAFATDTKRSVATANRRWVDVQKTLVN